MRWLVGWNGVRADAPVLDAGALRPVGGRLLWPGADPLWAVGDWRPDEIRSISIFRNRRNWRHSVSSGFPELGETGTELPPDDGAVARLVVLGRCGAADVALRTALLAASGGALRHLTLWPGSYVVVLQQGPRISVLGDLAGVHPVYHTPWFGGSAYATAALPLADLIDAPVDRVHLAARLALPDAPEGVAETSPFAGVRRVPPGQALTVHAGVPHIGVYEAPPGGVGTYEMSEASATAEVTRSLLESVRLRVRTPAPPTTFGLGALGDAALTPGEGGPGTAAAAGVGVGVGAAVPGRPWGGLDGIFGTPFRRRHDPEAGPARGEPSGERPDEESGEQPAPRRTVSVDLTGGSASTVLALLAAGVPRTASAPRFAVPAPRGDAGDVGDADGADGMDGPAGAGEATPSARHPVLGTFSEERWGDPRSYRTLRHGPPGAEPEEARRRTGAVRGSWARVGSAPEAEPDGLLAVTYTDAEGATGAPPSPAREAELLRARAVAEAAADRLDHVVVPGGQDTLPYADLADDPLAGPLTDEPGPALVTALRQRARLAAAGTEHISGHGARQVLDGHPARLADVLIDRRRSPLLRPVAALARADSAVVGTPVAVVRAARKLAKTAYVDGLQEAANALLTGAPAESPPDSVGQASTRALAWCTPGPAAPWLTPNARAAVAQRLLLAARAGAPDERPGARRARLALQRRAADFRVLAQIVESAPEARGQRLHAPFLDNQVVRACRLVPDRARIQPGARHGILRAVLAGAGVREVPDEWGNGLNVGPGATADSIRAGLRHSADALDRLFAAPLLGDWGLIDAPRVRETLRAAARGDAVPLDGLADVVATELWLRRLHARRGNCWSGLPPLPRPAVAAAH